MKGRLAINALAIFLVVTAARAGAHGRRLVDDFEDGDLTNALGGKWEIGSSEDNALWDAWEANPILVDGGRRLQIQVEFSAKASPTPPAVWVTTFVSGTDTRMPQPCTGLSFRCWSDHCAHLEVHVTTSDGKDWVRHLPEVKFKGEVITTAWDDFARTELDPGASLASANLRAISFAIIGQVGGCGCLGIDDLWLIGEDSSAPAESPTGATDDAGVLVSDALSVAARGGVMRLPMFTHLRANPATDLPIVDVRIPGVGKRTFVFDTGSAPTLLDSGTAFVASARRRQRLLIRAAAGEKIATALSTLSSVRIGQRTLRPLHVGISDFAESLGENGVRVSGLLSPQAFGDAVVTLDGPARRLLVDRSRPPTGVVIGKAPELGLPMATVGIGHAELECLVDSGDTGALSIPERAAQDAGVPIDWKDTGWQQGAAEAVVRVRSGILPELRLGSETLANVPVDSTVDGTCAIGWQILRAAVVSFDRAEHVVRLEKIDWHPPTTPESLGSGMLVERRCGSVYLVDVVPESAASTAGLQRGDLVETIDGFTATDFTAARLRSLSDSGRTRRLRVRRQGEPHVIEVKARPD